MDLKELNNYQLVLLTLLISFITSIATGITTVYLLQQAPPQVTGVINNVVEKTIQTVAPATLEPKTQTIIIKEDDLIATALAQGFQETGSLYTHTPVTNASDTQASGAVTDTSLAAAAVLAPTTSPETVPGFTDTFISHGALVDTNGTFIIPGTYTVTNGDYVKMAGGMYDVTKSTYEKASDITVITITPEKGASAFTDLSPNGIGSTPKVGQTALIVGTNGAFIKTTVSSVTPAPDAESYSSISVQDDIASKFVGSPVLSNDGKIIGIVTFDASGASIIYGADAIQGAITEAATTS